MKALLGALETAGSHGYTAVAEAILDLSFNERKSLADVIRNARSRNVKSERQLTCDAAVIVVRSNPERHPRCAELAQSVANQNSKKTVVLDLESGDPTKPVCWAMSEPRSAS